jgi:hypothetical protein
LVRLGRATSVQFGVPILFRVIRVHDWPTYDGWAWLDGYELNEQGEAIERRSVFVLVAGIERALPKPHLLPRRTDPRAAAHRAAPPGGVQRPRDTESGGTNEPA